MKDGIYIYGVIKTNDPQEFGEIGIGDQHPSKVLTIGYKDIAAVVSHSPLMTYDTLAKEQVVKNLAVHQLVIEKAMKSRTIVPVKFGTMVQSEDEVAEFLKVGYTLLSSELKKVEGKVELDLVAWWELPSAVAAISGSNSQLRAKQQQLAARGEQASVEEKIALGRSIEQAVATEKAHYNQAIMQSLQQESEDICLHELANEEMIFNAAFLLDRKKEPHFYQQLEALDERLEGKLNFRVVGPLPAYSFSTILFKRNDQETIEEAKKTLHISGKITEKTVRDAYRQLAKDHHPDRNGAEDSGDFQRINAAYNILSNFVENGMVYVEVYRWNEDSQ